MTARKNTARSNKAAQQETIEVKATVVDEPMQPEANASQAAFADFMASFQRYSDAMGVPSGRRVLVALAASFITGGIVGYVAGELLSYLVVGALMLTGSAFLSVLIYVLGVIATLYACWLAGGAVANYVLTKKADEHFNIAKTKVVGAVDYVRGWFKAATTDAQVA